VGVNRPVEDRWTAYQFGHTGQNTLYCSKLTCPPEGSHYGGTVFTVVDGHGGHACAHAINLLHSDYVVAGMLPPELCEQVLSDLRAIEGTSAPFTSYELFERLWSKPEAIPTGESEYIGPPRTDSPDTSADADPSAGPPRRRWAPWGIWGPLAASVREVHMNHLRKLIEESLSCSFEGGEAFFADNESGDICDPEGFIVAPLRSIQEAVSADLSNGQHAHSTNNQLHGSPGSSSSEPVSQAVHIPDPFLVGPDNPAFLRLHDRVAGVTRSLRNNLQRLDLDLSTSAQPSHRGPSLDKALLRIVFSGCVSTSAYIPCNGKELYVTQVRVSRGFLHSHCYSACTVR
ncbi:unnamed protein product, partial [Echinostoma caproni]|uniref:PPM-type phosphatase domain-containing protein n=1 Tax=Echinostoma caproni TaxID=27848 RepID=A0A183B108_9TREM